MPDRYYADSTMLDLTYQVFLILQGQTDLGSSICEPTNGTVGLRIKILYDTLYVFIFRNVGNNVLISMVSTQKVQCKVANQITKQGGIDQVVTTVSFLIIC